VCSIIEIFITLISKGGCCPPVFLSVRCHIKKTVSATGFWNFEREVAIEVERILTGDLMTDTNN
jgi:hypothetical protein